MKTKILQIINAVCATFGITADEMMRRDRTRIITMARFAAWRLMSEAGLTHQAIGDYYGMNQSSVAYGIKITHQWEERTTNYGNMYTSMLNEARRTTR